MEFAVDLLVTLVGLGVFSQHVWALRGHFASERMTPRAQVISAGALGSCLLMLVLLWLLAQPLGAQLVGVVIMAASLWLFRLAVTASKKSRLRFAFDDAPPESLVTFGPYRRIRHPFYTSYLIFWAGWAIATWSAWALLPVIVMTALYTMAARHEENLLSGHSTMGPDYTRYRSQTGLFWPKF